MLSTQKVRSSNIPREVVPVNIKSIGQGKKKRKVKGKGPVRLASEAVILPGLDGGQYFRYI